jgi:hypothetical protein
MATYLRSLNLLTCLFTWVIAEFTSNFSFKGVTKSVKLEPAPTEVKSKGCLAGQVMVRLRETGGNKFMISHDGERQCRVRAQLQLRYQLS